MRKGFTLIELLVVIAVMGVLAAGVVVAINPGKRIRQANDTKIKNDVGQIAGALQAYYTLKQIYPAPATWTTDIVSNGDLKMVPAPPGGGSYNYLSNPSPCVVGGSCDARLYFALQDPLVVGNVWCWRSATGAVKETTVALCAP